MTSLKASESSQHPLIQTFAQQYQRVSSQEKLIESYFMHLRNVEYWSDTNPALARSLLERVDLTTVEEYWTDHDQHTTIWHDLFTIKIKIIECYIRLKDFITAENLTNQLGPSPRSTMLKIIALARQNGLVMNYFEYIKQEEGNGVAALTTDSPALCRSPLGNLDDVRKSILALEYVKGDELLTKRLIELWHRHA